MLITYTSKRAHRPDIVGAELAPSMVYTNWTGGNSPTLSNDASGNLKVSYLATADPYAYVSITVVSGSAYRIKINSVADGTAVLPRIQIGTSPGNGVLGEYDFRNTTTTEADGTVDIPVVATGTSIVITCLCNTSSANYALFSGLSCKLISTLGHSSSSVMHDDVLATQAYTAADSTLSVANIFDQTYPRDDNAIVITNTGANSGQAQRTNKIPVVSGRSYKASAIWLPHSVSSGNVKAGASIGSSSYGTQTLSASIDSATSFFSAGSGLRWDFTNTDDGWVSTNIAPTNNATYIRLIASTTDPQFSKSGLSFSGYTNRYVATYLRRTSAGWNNEFNLYYSTAAHGFSSSYRAVSASATLSQNIWTVVVWDLWQLVAGGTDWKDSTITGLRIDYTGTSGGDWDVDWIAAGNINPLEMTFTPSSSDCFVSFNNSNESNAISYYILPHCDQLDSEYDIEQTSPSSLERVTPKSIGTVNTANSGKEWGVVDRIESGWQVTSHRITSAQRADWEEFFASVSSGETFTFDAEGSAATPDNPETVRLRRGSEGLKRIATTSEFNATFEVVKATIPDA